MHYVTRKQVREMQTMALGALLATAQGAAMPIAELSKLIGVSENQIKKKRALMRKTGLLGKTWNTIDPDMIAIPQATFDNFMCRHYANEISVNRQGLEAPSWVLDSLQFCELAIFSEGQLSVAGMTDVVEGRLASIETWLSETTSG